MSTDFRRALGPWSAAALIAGSMIGTGIFFFVADVAARLPSRGGILAAWGVGAVIAACGALSLAELAAAYPETGGIYVFLHRAFGPAVAFLYAWAKFLIMRPGSFAILAIAFASFSLQLFGAAADAHPWLARGIAIGAVVVLTAVNTVGVCAGAGVQNVLTAAKVLAVVAVIGVGAAYALGALEAHAVAIKPRAAEDGFLPLLFGAALIPVMWTYGGWDEAPFVAEEIRDPGRNLPLAIVGGVAGVALLFVLVNAAYLAILSPSEMAATGGRTATVAMERALGDGARGALSVALMVSTFGAANGLALTGGRIVYATGRGQALFRWFAHTHPRTKTPLRGLVAQCLLTIAALVLFANPFQLLLYTGLAYWAFAGLTAAAVFVLRRRDPDRERPFRVWGYPFTPALFVLASLGMAVSVAVTSPDKARVTVGILAGGAVVWAIQALAFRNRLSASDS
ncbi:MAG: amino acid permease [Planctomycetota bacterium]